MYTFGDLRLPLRFWEKTKVQPNGCWLWQACVNKDGYGKFRSDGKIVYAHRQAYVAFKGRMPVGLQTDHLCSNHKCVNPAHLEAVTARTNTLRSNSIAAKRAKQTSCINGHPFDFLNTYIRSSTGRRGCRACNRVAVAKYQSAVLA